MMDISDYIFHQPWLGLAAALVTFALLYLAMRRWPMPAISLPRRIVAWFGLSTLALAVGVMVAEPSLPAKKAGFAWAIIVDRSLSSQAAARPALKKAYAEVLALAKPGDQVMVAGYTDEVSYMRRWIPSEEAPTTLEFRNLGPEASDNNPQAALELARGSAPRELDLRVVLLSDGGGVDDIPSLPKGSVIVPLEYKSSDDVALKDLKLRAEIKEEGESQSHLYGDVEIWANVSGDCRIGFAIEGEEIEPLHVKVSKGLMLLPVDFALKSKPPFRVDVTIECEADKVHGNEALSQTIPGSQERLEVLIIDESEGFEETKHLVLALAETVMKVTLFRPHDLPEEAEWYDRFHAVIIANASADTISVRKQRAMVAWARGGGGLAMLGSPKTFGPGGWLGSPIEESMPLYFDPNPENIGDRAFVIVMDVSGSMGMTLPDGRQKVDHANHGAVVTLRMIGDDDAFGAIASGSSQEWIVPLADLSARSEVEASLRKNAAGGGGIYIDAGLDEAVKALRVSERANRYVLILGDGADTTLSHADGPSDREAWLDTVTQELEREGIGVSCVAIGSGSDTPLMKSLAERNRGRFFETDNAENLPLLFSAAAADMMGGFFQEGVVGILVENDGDLTTRLPWSSVPPLGGLIATKAREDSTIWLNGALDVEFPLLATRRYGLGHTLAFTSDVTSRWSQEWLEWPGYAKAWQRWVRWLAESAGWQGAAAISIDEDHVLYVSHQDVGDNHVFGLFRDHAGNISEAELDRVGPEESIWRLPPQSQRSGKFTFWMEDSKGAAKAIGEASVHQVNIGESWRGLREESALMRLGQRTETPATRLVKAGDEDPRELTTSILAPFKASSRRVRARWPALVLAGIALFSLLFARRFPAFFRDEGSEKNVQALATMRTLKATPKKLPKAKPEAADAMRKVESAAPSQVPSGGIDFDRLRKAKEGRRNDS